jgi:hypothetical protein
MATPIVATPMSRGGCAARKREANSDDGYAAQNSCISARRLSRSILGRCSSIDLSGSAGQLIASAEAPDGGDEPPRGLWNLERSGFGRYAEAPIERSRLAASMRTMTLARAQKKPDGGGMPTSSGFLLWG